MLKFFGIRTKSDSYFVRHLFYDESGKCKAKISPVLFWVIMGNAECCMMIPISKYDIENERDISYTQLAASCNSKSRSLVRKTKEGTESYPFSVVFRK